MTVEKRFGSRNLCIGGFGNDESLGSGLLGGIICIDASVVYDFGSRCASVEATKVDTTNAKVHSAACAVKK
jgi:hypothetical protein